MDNLLSQKVEISKLKKGDHVYTWRKQVYTHHGIFIGDGKIINFVQTNKNAILKSISASSSSIDGEKTPCDDESYCKSEKVTGSGVRMSCIACFIRTSSLYKYEYNVSSTFLIAKGRSGTCTTASSDTQEEVMRRVNYLYENGYVEYDWMSNNCEDFALYCKTGLWSTDKDHQGRSSQANMVDGSVDLIKELVLTNGSFVPRFDVSTMSRIAVAVPRSISKRTKNDLGNREDVVKVDVEKLSSFISSLKL